MDDLLHPSHLFHIGVVVDDMAAAMEELSRNLGLSFKGGKPAVMDTFLNGENRPLTMQIAHSIQGPPHFELLKKIPDTPWEAAGAIALHHLCYWSEEPRKLCALLEERGLRRMLGKPGTAFGYFQSPSGPIIEVIGKDYRDDITRWLQGARWQRNETL